MKVIKLLLLFFIFCTTANAVAAVCEYETGDSAVTRNIVLPTSVSIPRDAANGTVIYESVQVTNAEVGVFNCSDFHLEGIKNYLGQDVAGTIQPIGDTGIGWQWLYNGYPHYGVANNNSGHPSRYSFKDTAVALRFVKIGAIKSNALIPAGAIGAFEVGTIFPFIIETSGMSIVVPSCETPDVIVDMGSQDLSQFFYNAPYTASKRFNIKLNDCPVGIKKVNYKLIATSTAPAIDPTSGIISLNSTSTAKGIALQIMDSSEQPINLNLIHVFNDYSSGGGSFEIPMFARYFKKTGGDGEIKAGTANTEITFVMSYL
jgi:major type 1 subunit fimbrin (pilin)